MRAMLGIAISVPIAAIFCLMYLTALALEALHDATLSHRATRSVPLQREAWTGPARMAV